ncbi:MAG: hypothetical protein FJ249_11665 [Nitrospira sp.]|nr:hypothetical protein [Nitrospira sp.]
MRMIWVFFLCLVATLWVSTPAQGNTNDISHVIEGFMAKQFPEAQSHFWVVNGTQWQAENEVVVDLNTVVMGRTSLIPTENRFLLLIVEGMLAATQNIPLDTSKDCQPEQA